jgi:hypothetical protein
MVKHFFASALVVAFLALLALSAIPVAPGVADVKSPAGSGSAEPNLTTGPDGRVFMTWLEPGQGKGNVLYFSTLQSQAWSTPKVIARGSNWFVNAADFPSMTVMPGGVLASHWLVKSGDEDSEAYDINLSFSKDGGTTWSKPVVPHRDRKKRQHGFVSFATMADGKLAAIWLDGRNMPDEDSGNMALMYTTVTAAGALGPEVQIDNRVCECCKTSMTVTPDGMVAVYRDRSDKEIRDISISRFANGKWSPPETLSNDGWKIEGCPINGPAVSSSGKNLAVAWFTAPGEKPQVNVMMSTDSGKTFGKKVRIDEGNPAGKVEVLSLPSGDAIVSWIERTDKNGPQVHVRQVAANGTPAAPINASGNLKAASSGFPKIALSGNDIVVAWTESGEPSKVHTSVVTR